jgi:hypothetical protein
MEARGKKAVCSLCRKGNEKFDAHCIEDMSIGPDGLFLFCADQKRDPELQQHQQTLCREALQTARCAFPE